MSSLAHMGYQELSHLYLYYFANLLVCWTFPFSYSFCLCETNSELHFRFAGFITTAFGPHFTILCTSKTVTIRWPMRRDWPTQPDLQIVVEPGNLVPSNKLRLADLFWFSLRYFVNILIVVPNYAKFADATVFVADNFKNPFC